MRERALLQRDAEEDERYGEQVRGDELPAELERSEKRLTAIEQAKARLEAAQREADDARGRKPGQDRNPKGGRPYKRTYGEPEPKAQSNFTDPESQIMKISTEEFQQCYNAQMVVDEAHQIIVATEVEAQASDQGRPIQKSPSGVCVSPYWSLARREYPGIEGVPHSNEGKMPSTPPGTPRPQFPASADF